jgi:hypothetical protein
MGGGGAKGDEEDEDEDEDGAVARRRTRNSRRKTRRRKARRRKMRAGRGAARGGPGDPELLSDIGEMIYALSARETAAQKEGGFKKTKGRREGGSEPKQPRALAKAKKLYRDPKQRGLLLPLNVGRLACVCGSERPRWSSVNARIRLYFLNTK